MEVSSPPTSFDHISDTAFLLNSGTDPSSLPYSPSVILLFHKITGAGVLPAVFLGATADAISGGALYQLALALNFSTAEAVDVATMFLWNPLTIASCISGSADPLRLTAVFAAAAAAAVAAAAGEKKHTAVVAVGAGACFALAYHLSSSWLIILLGIPLIMLPSLNRQQKNKKNNDNSSRTTTTAAGFLFGFLAASFLLTLASNYLFYSRVFTLTYPPHHEAPPWSNIEPNLGLQWYFFAEVLPPFRKLYEYVFLAVPTALCIALVLRFGEKNPLVVMVGQVIVLCMLSRHPTYSDIMLWLALLPLVLLSGDREKEKGDSKEEGSNRKYIKIWLGIAFCISLGLNTAAYELWLTLGTGNANFFYGMNLIWAGWQALALVQLLKATSATEEDDGV